MRMSPQTGPLVAWAMAFDGRLVEADWPQRLHGEQISSPWRDGAMSLCLLGVER